ncbi:MAG: hypothetical protein IT370_13100 [Deltaproteobacteria bacterium]|nr:hypothetical protein [Deltaproteobacteria bacterium]
MARFETWLASPAADGPIELFPEPESVFDDWTEAHAERLLPVARFDLGLLGQADLAGVGVLLFYEDTSCSYLKWSMRDGKIVDLDPRWRELRPLQERQTRSALARVAGGSHARLERRVVELPPVSELGKHAWARAFGRALLAAGASNPMLRLRLGGHPCFVQADGYVDDQTFVLAELPTSALDLAPMYLYLFGDGRSFMQMMQMT